MVSLWCVIVHVASDAPVGRTTVCMFDIRAAAACLFWVVERWASQQRWFQLLCCHWSMVWNLRLLAISLSYLAQSPRFSNGSLPLSIGPTIRS